MVRAWALLLGILAAAWLPGCSSDDEVRPSPIPPGYGARLRQQQQPTAWRSRGGQTVDELLAVVDGEVLTRREVLRRLRLTEQQAATADVEEEIRTARKEWARQRLVMAAARRAGLSIPPSTIDDITREQLRGEIEANAKETGQTLHPEDYLKARGLTWDEYREQIKGLVINEAYIRHLTQGLGGGRPEVDWAVTPAEVRRIYYDNRSQFDVPAGVRMALVRFPLERFERPGLDLIDVEALAMRAAEAAQRDLQAGMPLEQVFQRHGVRPADRQIPKADEFLPRPQQDPARPWGEDARFLFDPRRRAGDAKVFPLDDGPHVITVLEVREARSRTLEEVYDDIVRLVQQGKQGRTSAQLVVEQIQRGGSVVWPPELADALLEDADGVLAEIASHPVLGRTRLR